MRKIALPYRFKAVTGLDLRWLRGYDWSALLSTVMLLALSGAIAYSLVWTANQHDDFQDGDYGAYYRAGKRVAEGRTPYIVDEHGPTQSFMYAPAFAFLFRPIAALDYLWGARVWMVINWGLCLACCYLALVLVLGRDWRGRQPWIVLLLALPPMANFLWANIRSGQAGLVVLAGCLGWAVCRPRGKHFTGGMLLAVGCAVKMFPVLLLPYLLVRRDYRGLAGVLAGGMLLFTFPLFWVGWQGTYLLHEQWPRHCLATQVPIQTTAAANQSALGLLAHLPWISNGETVYSAAHLHELEQCYPLIVLALTGLLYGLLAWRLRTSRPGAGPEHDADREVLHISVLFAFMTMMHVRGWTYNYVTLLPGCVLLARCVIDRIRPALALAGLAFVLVTGTMRAHIPPNAGWSLLAWLIQGKFFWAGAGLSMCCWLSLHNLVCFRAGDRVRTTKGGAPQTRALDYARFSSHAKPFARTGRSG